MSNHECTRRRLAENDIATVDACDCGAIHLHLGALSLRFTATAFDALAQVLETARNRRQAPSREASVGWASHPPGQA